MERTHEETRFTIGLLTGSGLRPCRLGGAGAYPVRHMRPSSYGYISRLVRDELTEAQAALVRAEATLAFEAVNRTEERLGARLQAKALQRISEAEETLKGLSRGLDDLARAKSLSNEAADAAFNALCNERVRMLDWPKTPANRAYVAQLETVSLWLTENFNVPVQ